MSALSTPGFPHHEVRRRALLGPLAVFPDAAEYGSTLYGAVESGSGTGPDGLDAIRLVPPVFVPRRLEKLIDLAREPVYRDVELDTVVGGLPSRLPVYLSAFGSTQVASRGLAAAASRQAARAGIVMVVGENVAPVGGYRQERAPQQEGQHALLARVRAYADEVSAEVGGVVVQQSTEDADAEVWNLVYSDPDVHDLLSSGRLAFELKVGQGAKPGLGGLTMVDQKTAARLEQSYEIDDAMELDGMVLRCSSPGTFTDEILRQQIRLMRNNYPRARVWVKLPPARDVAQAAAVAWAAGADAVTVDGAEAGTGWAPTCFLDHVGLPLVECLARIGTPSGCLLVSGQMWSGARAAKALALGATAVGLGRAALIAVDEDPLHGLTRLLACMATELRMLTSALGKYHTGQLDRMDLWDGAPVAPVRPATISAQVL